MSVILNYNCYNDATITNTAQDYEIFARLWQMLVGVNLKYRKRWRHLKTSPPTETIIKKNTNHDRSQNLQHLWSYNRRLIFGVRPVNKYCRTIKTALVVAYKHENIKQNLYAKEIVIWIIGNSYWPISPIIFKRFQYLSYSFAVIGYPKRM